MRLNATVRLGLGLVISLSAASAASGQMVLYVDGNATGPVHDGTSWCSAYTALQDALSFAEEAGGGAITIRVADGVYTPDQGANHTLGDRWATFRLIDNVALRGGYAGCGAADPYHRDIKGHETILSSDLRQDDVPVSCTQDFPDCIHYGARCVDGSCIIKEDNNENSARVVFAGYTDRTAELDGFTITGGRSSFGGGMNIYDANPIVRRCTFVGNAAVSGGGVMVSDGDPLLIDCTFAGNSAFQGIGYGGGINILGRGSNVMLVNCLFKNNTAGNYGGAIYNMYDRAMTAINCVFVGNSAVSGGAISTDYGSPTLINCTLVGNVATRNGGGAYNHIGSTPTFANCLLWGNRDLSGSGETAQLHNSPGPLPNSPPSSFIVNNSLVQGWTGALGGVGNIRGDPLLVDADGPDGIPGTEDDDLHLSPGSPCVDAGDNSALPADLHDLDGDGDTLEPFPFDFDGVRRIAGTAVDIGAYEFQPPTVTAQLDVQPGQCPNRINSRARSPLQLAVVGTDVFDVSRIIPESIVLTRADGTGAGVLPMKRAQGRRTAIRDVATPLDGELCDCNRQRGDGIDDYVVEFSTRRVAELLELGSRPRDSTVTLTLRGILLDGTIFEASDCVVVTGRRR